MAGPGKRRTSHGGADSLSPNLASEQQSNGFHIGTSSSETPATLESNANVNANAETMSTPTGQVVSNTDSSSTVKRKRGPTRNLTLAKKKQAGEKLSIEISEEDKRIVGLDCKSFLAEGGCIVRKQATLQVPKWSKIIEEERETMRKMVASSFEIKDSEDAKNVIDAQLNKQYRNYRYKLHKNHFEIHPSLEVALRHPPKGMSMENWEAICQYFVSPTFKKLSDKNKANRAKQNTPHTAGTKSFARIRYEKKVGPIKLYEISHYSDKKEAWVNNDAHEKHKKMTELQSESQVEGANPVTEEEICAQVLGQKSGYIRGRGAGPKPTSSSFKQQHDTDMEELRRRAEHAEQENSVIKQQNIAMQLEIENLKASQMRVDETLKLVLERMQNGGGQMFSPQ